MAGACSATPASLPERSRTRRRLQRQLEHFAAFDQHIDEQPRNRCRFPRLAKRVGCDEDAVRDVGTRISFARLAFHVRN